MPASRIAHPVGSSPSGAGLPDPVTPASPAGPASRRRDRSAGQGGGRHGIPPLTAVGPEGAGPGGGADKRRASRERGPARPFGVGAGEIAMPDPRQSLPP